MFRDQGRKPPAPPPSQTAGLNRDLNFEQHSTPNTSSTIVNSSNQSQNLSGINSSTIQQNSTYQQNSTNSMVINSSSGGETSNQVSGNSNENINGVSNIMGIIEEEDSLDFSSSVRSQFPGQRTPSGMSQRASGQYNASLHQSNKAQKAPFANGQQQYMAMPFGQSSNLGAQPQLWGQMPAPNSVGTDQYSLTDQKAGPMGY